MKAKRRAGEDILAADITKRGANGVPPIRWSRVSCVRTRMQPGRS